MGDYGKRKKTGYRSPRQGAVGRAANEAKIIEQLKGHREIEVSTLTGLGMEVSVARSTLERMAKAGKLNVRQFRNGHASKNYYSLSMSGLLQDYWIVRTKGSFLGQHWVTPRSIKRGER